MRRLLCLAACFTLLMLVAIPAASARTACVPRPGAPDFVCGNTYMQSDGTLCATQSINPPAPGTWQSSTTCSVVGCPPWLCVPPTHTEGSS